MSLIQLATPQSIVGKHEKFLFYGFPKTGKTFASLTAPDPILFIAVGNINEVKTMYSKEFQEKYPGKIVYVAVAEESRDERGQFKEAIGADRVSDIIDEALERDADPDDEFYFNSIVIDNATILGQYQMYKTMEVSYSTQLENKKRTDKTALDKYRKKGILIPGDNDWMGQMSLNEQFVAWLFRIPKHVVLIAHKWQETAMDRATKTTTVLKEKPLFTGKQRDSVPGLFDNVWHFDHEGQFFTAQTKGDDSLIAGTRVGGIIPTFYRDVNLTEAIRDLQRASGVDPDALDEETGEVTT